MIKRIGDFETKTFTKPDVEELALKCGEKIKVYTIKNVNDLIQFIGYGKYINKKEI